jgi:hypothetical protein
VRQWVTRSARITAIASNQTRNWHTDATATTLRLGKQGDSVSMAHASAACVRPYRAATTIQRAVRSHQTKRRDRAAPAWGGTLRRDCQQSARRSFDRSSGCRMSFTAAACLPT